MKEVAFVIAEYDPFHNGHRYLIDKIREAGAETVIAVMSGNFVQRGTPAIFDKRIRAQAAILGGADLVIELPLKYAVSGAEGFAMGAVKTLACLGIDGTLAFGASHSLEALKKTADTLNGIRTSEMLSSVIRESGKNYASATSLLAQKDACVQDVLQDANSLLAVEYIQAVNRLQCAFETYAVKRTGNPHNSPEPEDCFASAQYIRKCILDGDTAANNAFDKYCPRENSALYRKCMEYGNYFRDYSRYDVIVMLSLLSADRAFLATVNGVNQGLENRIAEGVLRTNTFAGLCDYVKSKRFTHSRIRRCVTCAVLGVTKHDAESDPSYIRVLGFDEKGRALLRKIRDTVTVPVITNISDVPQNNECAVRDKALDCKAAKLYELCKAVPVAGNPEYPVKPFVLH